MLMTSLFLLLLQTPDSQYAGGASSKTAGTTDLGGHLFRFLFTTVPQWVQLAGIFIGVPVAIIVAWQMVKHRRAIWAWWVARTRGVQVAIVTAVFVVGAAGLGSGLYGYNYVMHENDFCQSCHIMDTAWNRFQVSAHKEIQCHGCHRQPMYVSSVELFWWVTERRMMVPPHDKVPSKVCSECHMRTGTDSARTLVTLTAGHALHLQSDSSALKNVQCTNCHGRDFHQFKPTSFGCTQSGCHLNLKVNLGAMSQKGFLHCTSCHDFKNPMPAGATVAQAKLALVPDSRNCFKCHAMTDAIKRFDLASDPHKGSCGMCHDVHKQTGGKDAFKSCATAQCHASADTLTAFHRGLGKHAIDKCSACHQAHSWKVKGSNCIACHENINKDTPSPRRASATVLPEATHRSIGRGVLHTRLTHLASFTQSAVVAAPRGPPPAFRFAARTLPAPRASAPDSAAFPHSRHKALACTDCHSTADSHGGLKFSRPSGCIGCHHAARQKAPCSACHATTSRTPHSVPMTFVITARRDPVTRPITFAHARHVGLACARCHANDSKKAVTTTCEGCHADHHSATADCATCHPTARVGHDRFSHEGCARCHTDTKVAALPASRAVCVACHLEQRTHYPAGDCATCHATSHDMMRAGRVGT